LITLIFLQGNRGRSLWRRQDEEAADCLRWRESRK
jgi:hypothetical protein